MVLVSFFLAPTSMLLRSSVSCCVIHGILYGRTGNCGTWENLYTLFALAGLPMDPEDVSVEGDHR